MFERLKTLIKRNICLTRILQWVFYSKQKSAANHANSRVQLELTELTKLASDLSLIWEHPVIDNNYYGINRVLSDYSGIKNINERILVEHGLILGSLSYDVKKDSFAERLITFSNYREENIKQKRNYHIDKIGPYIHYASLLYNGKILSQIKELWGKTLLVFPSHSIKSLTKEFNISQLVEEINRISSGFDSVVICLYWKDIQLGRDIEYKKHGFKIVTAGHHNDLNFLRRLKTIIYLSDYTMSNDVGTHLGYCIYMNKPHYVFSQSVKYSIGISEKSYNKEVNVRNSEDKDSFKFAHQELSQAFSFNTGVITDSQRELVNYYWGIDCLKSKEELCRIII